MTEPWDGRAGGTELLVDPRPDELLLVAVRSEATGLDSSPARSLPGGALARALITLDPRRVVKRLLVVVALLVALHLVVVSLRMFLGWDSLLGLAAITSVDHELTIPTVFSGMVMLAGAAALALAGRQSDGERALRRGFKLLAVILAFLAVDEMTAIHEIVGRIFRRFAAEGASPFWVWLPPYAAAMLALLLCLVRFLAALPARTRRSFIVCGALFVAGAMGLEVLGGLRAKAVVGKPLNDDWTYLFLATAEETLEMASMVLFLGAVLTHLLRAVSRDSRREASGAEDLVAVPVGALPRR